MDMPSSLTLDESYVLVLRNWIVTHKGPVDQTPQEKGDQPGNEIDMDAQQPPAHNGTGEGPCHRDHLKACRNALRAWQIEIWMRDFR